MKRYKAILQIGDFGSLAGTQADDEGEYVRYEDAQLEIEQLQIQVKELHKMVDSILER